MCYAHMLGRPSDEACMAVFDLLKDWYNARRRHSALDYYLSPAEFTRWHKAASRRVIVSKRCWGVCLPHASEEPPAL